MKANTIKVFDVKLTSNKKLSKLCKLIDDIHNDDPLQLFELINIQKSVLTLLDKLYYSCIDYNVISKDVYVTKFEIVNSKDKYNGIYVLYLDYHNLINYDGMLLELYAWLSLRIFDASYNSGF